MKTRYKFDKRAFTSSGLFICTVLLPLSVFIWHLPMYEQSAQARHICMSIHATSGVVFIILLVTHISLNWSAVRKHLSLGGNSTIKKEVYMAVAIVILSITILAMYDYIIK